MLQELPVSGNIKFVPKKQEQKSAVINTTPCQFSDPGMVDFSDLLPFWLCYAGYTFSTWETSDSFSPSSPFGLLKQLGLQF